MINGRIRTHLVIFLVVFVVKVVLAGFVGLGRVGAGIA